MTGTSFTSQRLARESGPRANRRPRRVVLLVEELDGRIVPSYFPATTNGVHVLEDQLPGGLSSAMVHFVATHTDGTEKETLAATNQFRAINPDYTVLHYQLGTGNSAYDYIINNQWSSDFSYVTQHEDWFAHQSYSGEPQSAADLASGRVGNNTGWYQADIANPAWQQYTLNQVFQNMAATGSNAWFADSYTFGLGGAGYNAPVPTRYQGTNAANPAYWPGGVTWTTQLGNWAQAVENAFAQHNATFGTDYKFLPNLDGRATSWEPDWYNNASGVPIVDGAFLESFGQYTDTYNWTLSMNRGLNLTHNGKIVIMQPYPSAAPNTAAGQQQVDFFLGTYLLLKGDRTYLNIDYGGGVQYYPEYQLNLGAPAAPPPGSVAGYLWNGVYRRDFQNGFVLVNPGSTTYTLSLGGTYQQVRASGGGTMTDAQIDANGNYTGGSLTYQGASSVTLTGGTAAVFLNPTSVSGVTVNAGAAQRSRVTTLAVTFSTAVTLLPGAFSLTRVGLPNGAAGDNAAVGTINVSTQTVNGVTVATLTFSGANTTAGSLDDGNWTLTVDHTKVVSAVGSAPMAADYSQAGIRRLFGDGNGDGRVDNADFFLLRSTFGLSAGQAGFLAAFDYDGSGLIDNADFFQFRARFGLTI
jgi:hypothetical protein